MATSATASTTADRAAKAEIKEYTFFNPKLRDDSYATGDIYNTDEVKKAQDKWAIRDEGPYLTHIKSLSTTWHHLRLLADFMEVSTTPIRWAGFGKRKAADAEQERDERARRTNVMRLDYLNSGEVVPQPYNTPEELSAALKNEAQENDNDQRQLRLFIVEDLSRQVIEILGGHLDIEPAFFREHIVDYAWYNTRDRWVDPPNLNLVTRRNRWVPLRFVTARYFNKAQSFQEGVKEAELFNVLRRPDDDQNNKSLWDDNAAIVGITRTRASFWLSSADTQKKGAVGVLLLDPTIKAGVPLWYGYRNWEATPGMKEETPPGPPRVSLFNDLIYWAQRPEAFKKSHADNSASNVHIPIQALLHIICAEWLTIADYIKTRLGQIEWEISFPEHFLDKKSDIDVALKKLHVWRRLVPLYREMLTETLQRAFHFPCHTTNMVTGEGGIVSSMTNGIIHSNGGGDNSTTPTTNSTISGVNQQKPCQCPLHSAPAKKGGPISAFSDDFTRALSYMEEYQQRIDRLTSVVTAIISIGDSRRAQVDARNVARLTWLATFFIPLSFMSGLFSMQTDLSQLMDTYKLYFEIAMPLAIASLGLAFVLALPSVRRFGHFAVDKLKNVPRAKNNR